MLPHLPNHQCKQALLPHHMPAAEVAQPVRGEAGEQLLAQAGNGREGARCQHDSMGLCKHLQHVGCHSAVPDSVIQIESTTGHKPMHKRAVYNETFHGHFSVEQGRLAQSRIFEVLSRSGL